MTRSLTMLLALFCAALTISSACTAGPASSGTNLVRYDDLDLSRATDVRTLNQRIERAANAVCAHATGPSPAAAVDVSCKADAVRAARAQVEDLAVKREAAASPAPSRQGLVL
jgi:UrcA family protein